MLRRVILALSTAIVAVCFLAGPAQACGYWSCTLHEYGYECYWFDG